MTKPSPILLWSPRILGIAVCGFLALFSLDAFGGGVSLFEALPGFAVHVAPVLALLVVVLISWRWEWVGGLVFIALAACYAYVASDHASWVAVISGPLLLVGALFSWSWMQQRRFGRDAA
jgi:hypothetical protein